MCKIFNFLNFYRILCKFLQLDFETKNQNFENSNKIFGNSKCLIFSLNVINLTILFVFISVDLYKWSFDIERFATLVVVLAMIIRSVANYIVLFSSQAKIKTIYENLPKAYTKYEKKSFNVIKRLKYSRIPSLSGFFISLIAWAEKVFTFKLTEYRQNVIQTDFKIFRASKFLSTVYDIWPFIAIATASLIIIVYESVLYELMIKLNIEFRKLKFLIDEIFENFEENYKNSSQIIILNEFKSKIAKHFENTSKSSPRPGILKHPETSKHQTIKSTVPSRISFDINNNPKIHKHIHKIVDRHVKLLDIRNQIEEVFSCPCLVNLLTGLACLCMEEFCSLIIENLKIRIALALTGITQILVMFIQCHYSQELKDVSSKIADSLYDCKWEDVEDLKARKNLMMILMRSQKSKTLTCWKFVENSFELFGSVKDSCIIIQDYFDV